ncbi:helix-turn-helix domain-containing protein [Pseudomonas sp. ACN5]|uniref:helix-turn-helix domain-containing protein n=1 Tax=Pseudomonas sp. ACN5 TaxID=1920427 RepID=UPI0015571B98|nr:AraC family transcriptional regulator [Pseudomonas sp. ACN5]PBJ07712.1 HTH-type transcriptional regulator VirS [Pseudomonas sp. ACN5]
MPLPASALRARLAEMLTGEPDLELLSRALEISPALLSSNLSQQDLSFNQLLDQAREAQALVLLANPALSLEQVASQLGFSSASSLGRAFRRWQDNTPLNYRRQVLG